MRRVAVVVACLAVLLVVAIAYIRSAQSKPIVRSEFVMGTLVQIKAYGRNADRAIDEVVARLHQINDRMTINEPGSEILQVNKQAGEGPVAVSPDTFFVVEKALEYARLTDGKFDPTVEPLVSLWRIGFPDARVPKPAEIASAVKLVGYENVQLDPDKRTIFLPKRGMGLDLGAIAKGYAADEAQAILLKFGVRNALISIGGNIYAMGRKPDGSKWRVGVQDPLDERGTYMGIVDAEDETLVTSGAYERFLEVDGKRYHHILDPDSGYPAETDLLSTTIVSKKSIDADALSTSLFILGRDKALEFIKRISGVDVILIDKERKVYISDGLRQRFSITDEKYRMAQ